jgi:hypothetical protein
MRKCTRFALYQGMADKKSLLLILNNLSPFFYADSSIARQPVLGKPANFLTPSTGNIGYGNINNSAPRVASPGLPST